MELSWGKCTIKIGKLQSSGEAPSSWIDIPTPVENSTKLTPTKGAKKEAKIEGGETRLSSMRQTPIRLSLKSGLAKAVENRWKIQMV